MRRLSLCALLAALAAPTSLRADEYADAVAEFKTAWTDAEPKTAVDQWLAPFHAKDRSKMSALRLVSDFGAPRQSYVKGHWHTATDMWPSEKTKPYVDVLAMANGVVVSIHLADPHRTVVVKHKLPDGSYLWTSYKHLQSSDVTVGQEVTPDTKIGRLFTKVETKAQGGDFDHLHLEIRTNIEDYGVGSWMTMSKDELSKRFLDPWKFLKANLGPVKAAPAK